MKNNVDRRCRECGIGKILPVARAGRKAQYKTMELEIPATVVVPTCDNCGAEWMDRATARKIDHAMEAVYRQALRNMLLTLLDQITAHAPMRQVERLIGLSEGYLSKVKSGRSEASAELLSSLSLLARDVSGGLKDLGRLWTEAEKNALHERKYGPARSKTEEKKSALPARKYGQGGR